MKNSKVSKLSATIVVNTNKSIKSRKKYEWFRMKSDSDDIFDNNILGIYHYILIGISQQSESNTF